MSTGTTMTRFLRVDLTGSNVGPGWLATEVRGNWPVGWTDNRLRQATADHYEVPVEQVTVVPPDAEVCCDCGWHLTAEGCNC